MIDEVTQYIVFRADLNLSRGKTAAQAGHAVQLVLQAISPTNPWLVAWGTDGNFGKIALQVPDLAALEALKARLAADGIVHSWIVDAGRTETEAGTVTCMALQPLPRSVAAKYVGSLALLR
jgi:PTH2 family peptidyl-tRNA hydrolase